MRIEDLSDEDLLRGCRTAQESEVRRVVGLLYSRHHHRLFNFLRRFLGAEAATEDVVQETFVRLYRNARNYREVARFTTWIYRIATNLALNELRRRKTHAAFRLDPEVDRETLRVIDMIAGGGPSPIDKMTREELSEAVDRALSQMPEQYRAVLLLCDMEDHSYEEAGEILGLRGGTIGSRLSRARRMFANLLARALPR